MIENEQTQELVRLAKNEALVSGDFPAAMRAITESASRALNVERVSIWFYDETRSLIRCADLFERSKNAHSNGVELLKRDFPDYFLALETERTIDANDAHADPRTREFSECYLRPCGIGAMLDAPIRIGGEMVGVVCHEHVGAVRTWSSGEMAFGGSMADLVSLGQEIRDRKLAEEALKREVSARATQDRLAALGEMSAVVAHEVRNPIGAIYNTVSCLRRLVGSSEEVQPLLVVLEEESQRLIELTDNLLDVARPMIAESHYCELQPILDRALDTLRRQPRYADRELLFDTRAIVDDLTVYTDVNLLHRVCVNLLTNAVEAAEEGGVVTIATRTHDAGWLEIAFSNQGEALTADEVERIFEPFVTTKAVGSGLGLAIVRSLMVTLQGRVEVGCDGETITFSIHVPTSPPSGSTLPPSDP